MRILVCIKQISTSDINIDGSGRWINQGGSSAFAISRFDENAVEESILLKERLIEKSATENSQAKDSEFCLKNNKSC